jgi:hypothetical protein
VFRQNTHELRANIATAQQIIYDDGYMVNSHVLDPFLKEGSYVPTEVSCSMCFMSISKGEQNAFAHIPGCHHSWEGQYHLSIQKA